MRIVGERLNATRKTIREAIEKKDEAFIANEAKKQHEAGADVIDVNAGMNPEREAKDMEWMLSIVENTVDTRISLDSSSGAVILANIHKVKNPPMINSITLESKKFEDMIPVIEAREADIIALCMDDRGLPKDADMVCDNAHRLVSALEKRGVKRERIYLDPLVQSVSADSKKGVIVLETIERIMRDIDGANTICGLSNVSFGLPERFLVNRTFLALALGAGLSAAIVDPTDEKLMTVICVTEMLLGKDNYCRNYLTAFRKSKIVG